MTTIGDMDFKETPESIKTLINAYRMNPQFIPDTEWLDIAQKFVEVVDEDEIPFDQSLISFADKLCKGLLSDIVKQRNIEFLSPEEQMDLQKDIFSHLNLGFLYGFSLGRLMHDTSIKQGDIS